MALGEHDDPTLPCGRTLSSVWADRDGDPGADADPHAGQCPYCQEALAGLGVLDGYVREARRAAAEAGQADDRDAERFTARVMDLVRTELRPGRTLPLGGPEDDAWITEAAAAKAFRAAAETLPDVQAGSCRVTLLAPQGPMKVALELVAGYEWPLPALADRVRERVRAAARDGVGLAVEEIDVSVVDLVESDTGDGPDAEDDPDAGERSTS
ncbi:Asp23/Gls24 family envelope stress response protein [Streptomyces albofaciens]|uniref:Asp23/Gls24 family envelope stress response protein n=1 Tax=Streptomyces albofaciens TaxID=66866 RepID=UPI001AD72C13|nr:Asp23/Gls24 family envelope stress response protein [Streptomyces albofaciens]